MKIPITPPTLNDLLVGPEFLPPERLGELLSLGIGPAPGGHYRHWDQLRRIHPPKGVSSEEWWAAIKFARSQSRRPVPLRDKKGKRFSYCIPDAVLGLLHEIDTQSTGPISTSDEITNPQTKDRYVQSSLIEEAITSSQLEGASTTREVAKEMIRSGRSPVDRSELMILNNYRAIQLISQFQHRELSPELVFELHSTITEGTLRGDGRQNHLRTPSDEIAVYDDRDNTLLHMPPDAVEIPARLDAMCEFANSQQAGVFMHPVVKAIILHFWLAYDHPFVDGNGRTARALFYWAMLHQGFWLFEFISISRIIRSAPVKYGRSFLYVETDENDLTYFVLAQLDIVKKAIDELNVYIERKSKEIRQTENLLRSSVSINHRQLAVLSHALRHPGMRYTIESHRKSHRVAYQSARTDLLGLCDRGLFIKTRAGRAFVFRATEDLDKRLQRLR